MYRIQRVSDIVQLSTECRSGEFPNVELVGPAYGPKLLKYGQTLGGQAGLGMENLLRRC